MYMYMYVLVITTTYMHTHVRICMLTWLSYLLSFPIDTGSRPGQDHIPEARNQSSILGHHSSYHELGQSQGQQARGHGDYYYLFLILGEQGKAVLSSE